MSQFKRSVVALLSICVFLAAIFVELPRAFGDIDDVDAIVSNIRSSEQLYKNIEMQWVFQYRLGDVKYMIKDKTLKSNTEFVRVVKQGDYLYSKFNRSQYRIDKQSKDFQVECGFDGETSRIVDLGAAANITDEVFDGAEVREADPFRMLFMLDFVIHLNICLSTLLSSGESIKQYHGYEHTNIKIVHEKDETIDGLDCIKLGIYYWFVGTHMDEGAVTYIWLARERNLIPIKYIDYHPKVRKIHPSLIGYSSDFREIAPGVWFPHRYEINTYDNDYMTEDNKVVKGNNFLITIVKAELDPDYPRSFFQNIPIPDGTMVYEIKKKETVAKYVQGLPLKFQPKDKARSSPSIWWLIGAIVSFSIAFVVWKRISRRVPIDEKSTR